MSITFLLNVWRVFRREHAKSVCSIGLETEVDAVSAELVVASGRFCKVFSGNVKIVFDAQNFHVIIIGIGASYIVIIVKFAFTSFCYRNPHADNGVNGFSFFINASSIFNNSIVGFARQLDKLVVFRVIFVCKNAERQCTRAGNDFLQSGDFSSVNFRNNDFNRVGTLLTNGNFFNSSRVKTSFENNRQIVHLDRSANVFGTRRVVFRSLAVGFRFKLVSCRLGNLVNQN